MTARESSGRMVGRRRRPDSKHRSSTLRSDLKRCDMYGHVPTYDLPAFTSWFGVAATVVTVVLFLVYMLTTTVQYITKPPELGLQGTLSVAGQSFPAPSFMGFWVEYRDANGNKKRVMPLANTDYFSIEASHMVHQVNLPRTNTPLSLKECPESGEGHVVCIDHDADNDPLMLEGDFTADTYKYIKVVIRPCRNSTYLVSSGITCAIDEHIQMAIKSSVVVGAVFYVQKFNTSKDKAGEESLSLTKITHRWFLVPGLEVKNEVFLLGRYIQHENRYLGSPPYPETETRLLDFEQIDSLLAPAHKDEEYMTFYVRLGHNISLEETSYWMPSILDLFGAWGAMASFLATLSLGLVARKYNQKRADSSFREKLALLGGREHDVRLYEREHFDEHGRLVLTANELNHPTTAYGELRSYASREHTRKKTAVDKIRLLHSRSVGSVVENDESLQPLIATDDRAAEDGGHLAPVDQAERRARRRAQVLRNVESKLRQESEQHGAFDRRIAQLNESIDTVRAQQEAR